MINWKVRAKQPAFWIGIVGVVGAPVLAYFGISAAEVTSWEQVGNLFLNTISNPYLLGSVIMAVLGAIGVIADPTTAGLGDSCRAMSYSEPNDDKCDGE